MFGFDDNELNVLNELDSPRKIQRFLDELETNFEIEGESCMSPREALRKRKAHCVEGALIAAAALRLNGYSPLVVDLTTSKKDYDHVIAVFKKDGFWGAISKTNHSVLKYRDPIYKSVRELVMSYFNEYFLNNGEKTLRSYSNPVDLSRFDHLNWMTSEEDVWFIPSYLAEVKHFPVLTKKQIFNLKKADPIEVEASKLESWKREGDVVKKEDYHFDNIGKEI